MKKQLHTLFFTVVILAAVTLTALTASASNAQPPYQLGHRAITAQIKELQKRQEGTMQSATYTKKFSMNQPADVLFPLFSAEGETLWVPDWKYENVMGSTELHEDYVFLTQTHDHASTKAIWLVKRYDPKTYFVQFYKVEPNDKVGIVTVKCTPVDATNTEVQVSYQYIGIDEKGNKFISTFTAEDYSKYIDEWKTLLIKYFASQS